MKKSFEFRLDPTPEQVQALTTLLELSGRLYNLMLKELIDYYHKSGKHLNMFSHSYRHRTTDHPGVPSAVIKGTLREVHKAFEAFYQAKQAGRDVSLPPYATRDTWHAFVFLYPCSFNNQAANKS